MTRLSNILRELGRMLARNFPFAPFSQRVNLHIVEEWKCYRTSQPGKKQLERIIRDLQPDLFVVALKNVPEWEARALEENGIDLLHVPVYRSHRFTNEIIDTFLKHTRQHKRTVIHCLHGRDRTGLLCAVYRVEIQGYSPQEAWDEMTQLGHGALPTRSRLKSVLEGRYGVKLKGSVNYI